MQELNLNFQYDDNLREHPESPSDFLKAARFLERELKDETDPVREAALMSKIGVYYRIAGDLATSLKNLKAADPLLDPVIEPRLKCINWIRLATTYQWMRDFDNSDTCLQLALHTIDSNNLDTLTDFVYQHQGKSYFDRKWYGEARDWLQKALELRIKKDNKELIQSTRFALQIVDDKIRQKKASEG